MAASDVTQTLNKLLAAEYASMLPRLRQSDLFVALRAANERSLVEGFVRDNEKHERLLFGLIAELRGAPAPAQYNIDMAAYHYLDIAHLMPIIIESIRELIGAYSSAGGTGHARADAMIASHLSDYQDRLKKLEALHAPITR